MTTNEIIKIEHLSKKFGNLDVLKDINLTIKNGEVVVILGSSGSGKSTLLRCMNLLEIPTSGKVFFDNIDIINEDVDIDRLRAKMTMVFQQFNLFNNKNVIGNCMLAQQKVLKRSAKEAEIVALKNLEKVGMLDKKFNRINQISGGQKQRVAIARALSMDPEIILFDEPTSALDPEMVNEVLQVIKELAKEGRTMVIVTHEMNFAKNVADRIVFMDDGFVIEDGTPNYIFEECQNPRLLEFLNKTK